MLRCELAGLPDERMFAISAHLDKYELMPDGTSGGFFTYFSSPDGPGDRAALAARIVGMLDELYGLGAPSRWTCAPGPQTGKTPSALPREQSP
jgi:hypothetical protein